MPSHSNPPLDPLDPLDPHLLPYPLHSLPPPCPFCGQTHPTTRFLLGGIPVQTYEKVPNPPGFVIIEAPKQ